MKKFIHALIAGVLAIFSVSATAQSQPDGISGFVSDDACVSAVFAGKAKAYEPKISRSPGPQFGRMTMHNAGYQNGACVQGLTTFTQGTWVYLPSTFQVGQNGEHLVMWQCANAITIITAIPTNQVVNRPAASINFSAATPLVCKGEEECKQVNWCEANNGWYASKDGAGNNIRKCDVPGEMSVISKQNIVRIQEQTTILPEQLPTEVRPWKVAAPVVIPPAPAIRVDVQGSQGPVVNMARQSQGTVSGTRCSFDCISREVTKDVVGHQNIPSVDKQCEIRWSAANQQGRLLIDNYSGKIRLASVVSGQSSPSKVMVTPANASRDCNLDQGEVKKNWDSVVRMMGLPPTCKPV